MILTDGVHLISDKSIDELHTFAQGMGLKRHWFHNRRGRKRPHYDLRKDVERDVAVKLGAIPISPTDLMIVLREVNP